MRERAVIWRKRSKYKSDKRRIESYVLHKIIMKFLSIQNALWVTIGHLKKPETFGHRFARLRGGRLCSFRHNKALSRVEVDLIQMMLWKWNLTQLTALEQWSAGSLEIRCSWSGLSADYTCISFRFVLPLFCTFKGDINCTFKIILIYKINKGSPGWMSSQITH